MADDGRNSGMRGRASRRGATAPEAEAAGAEYEELAAGGDGEDGGWKAEVESITNGAPSRARRGARPSSRPAPCPAARAQAAGTPTSASWRGSALLSSSPRVVHLAGTHPALLAELKKHEQTMNAHIAQAQRVHQLQKANIDALFDCEKKEAADENKVRRVCAPEQSLGWDCVCMGGRPAALAARLPRTADAHHTTFCARHRPSWSTTGPGSSTGSRRSSANWLSRRASGRAGRPTTQKLPRSAGGLGWLVSALPAAPFANTRLRTPALNAHTRTQNAPKSDPARCCATPTFAVFDAATYALPPDQLKADLEEIENAASRYSVRTAAIASEDLRNAGNDIYFDRSRHLLHCNGHSFERDAWVAFIKEGHRIEDRWSITAMNAVEVTLQSIQGTKQKVTLAMLRNGRCVLRPL